MSDGCSGERQESASLGHRSDSVLTLHGCECGVMLWRCIFCACCLTPQVSVRCVWWKAFPRRESNPGHLGDSQESQPLHHTGRPPCSTNNLAHTINHQILINKFTHSFHNQTQSPAHTSQTATQIHILLLFPFLLFSFSSYAHTTCTLASIPNPTHPPIHTPTRSHTLPHPHPTCHFIIISFGSIHSTRTLP